MPWTGTFRDANCLFGSTTIVTDIPILKQARAEYARLHSLRPTGLLLKLPSEFCSQDRRGLIHEPS